VAFLKRRNALSIVSPGAMRTSIFDDPPFGVRRWRGTKN